jgi:hypothetical protein
MKSLINVCVLGLFLSLVPAVSARIVEQDGKRVGVVPTIQATEAMRNNPVKSDLAPLVVCENGVNIDYHCGLVMNQGINTYVFVYGDWSAYGYYPDIIMSFLDNIGGTPYFNINTSYDDGAGNFILNSLINTDITIRYVDPYARGHNLSFNDISLIVADGVASGFWGSTSYDPNGIYLVLTAPDVMQTNGPGEAFCQTYCGWHTYLQDPQTGNSIAYGFIGNPVTQCRNGCEPFGGGNAPNGNEGHDAMVSIIAHEINEATTDPALAGWYQNDLAHEVGDLCNFNFGATYITPNGSLANQNFGGFDYLVQQNFVNADQGGQDNQCVQAW